MRFPKLLIRNNRPCLSEYKIHNKNFMYARHKPGSEWIEGEEYPDFSKIKSNQSFNWSAFSLPVWVRFNHLKEYKNEYGVLGYSVNTIRNTNLFTRNLNENTYGVKHIPIDFNYSHCELFPINVDKKQKREFRLMLKNNCSKELYPHQKCDTEKLILDYIKMLRHWLLMKFS